MRGFKVFFWCSDTFFLGINYSATNVSLTFTAHTSYWSLMTTRTLQIKSTSSSHICSCERWKLNILGTQHLQQSLKNKRVRPTGRINKKQTPVEFRGEGGRPQTPEPSKQRTINTYKRTLSTPRRGCGGGRGHRRRDHSRVTRCGFQWFGSKQEAKQASASSNKEEKKSVFYVRAFFFSFFLFSPFPSWPLASACCSFCALILFFFVTQSGSEHDTHKINITN